MPQKYWHALKRLMQCVKDLKHKYAEKEDRYKSLASLDEMHSKLEELKKQMAWALVSSCLTFLKNLKNPSSPSLARIAQLCLF